MTHVDPVRTAELSVDVSADAARLTAVFMGSADNNVVQVLGDFMARLHKRALSDGVREVVADLRQLEFMNSSCLKTFVTWLSAVVELPDPSRYRIVLQSDPGKHWQKRSLAALQCFAPGSVTVLPT